MTALMLLQEALRTTPLSTSAAGSDVRSFFGTSAQLWAVGLIFLRLSGVIMLMPGVGDQAVPGRLRIGFAFLLALVVSPVVYTTLPPVPDGIGDLIGQVLHEVIIGLMLGTLLRVLLYTMMVAGEIMSLQTTLSFAQTTNPSQAQPSTSIATFLSMLGLVLIYATNLHHLFIRAMVDSYHVFSPVRAVMLGDAGTLMIRTVGQCFMLALQMSAPLIVFAIVFNVATGFVGRIMPNFPVFFAATPLSVLFGLSLIALGLGGTGMVFIDHYRDFLALFLRGEHG